MNTQKMALWSILIFQNAFRQFEAMILKLVFGKECPRTLQLFHIFLGFKLRGICDI